MKKALTLSFINASLVAGCAGGIQSPIATSSEASRSSLGRLCERYVSTSPSNNFHIEAKKELLRRGVNLSDCFQLDSE